MARDIQWQVPEACKLWVTWKAAEHCGAGLIKLSNCCFTGPVVSDLVTIGPNEAMTLDLTEHFLLLVATPYLVSLQWENIKSQNEHKVELVSATLHDQETGCLKLLKNEDRFLVDFTGHRTEDQARGYYKPNFRAMLYDTQMSPYKFF